MNKKNFSETANFIRKNKLLSLITVTGALLQIAIVVPFEKIYCSNDKCGMWFANKIFARDDLWQIAISQVAFSKFPPILPIASDIQMSGYHFLYSLIVYLVSLSKIDAFLINSFFYPIIWVAIYSYLSYTLGKALFRDTFSRNAFMFFQFFGGSFGYLLTYYHSRTLLYSEGMTYQPILYLTNKPLSLSILLFLITITLIIKNKNAFTNSKIYLSLMFITFLTWGAKFHGGFALSVYIGLSLLAWVITKRIKPLRAFVLTALLLIFSTASIILFYRPSLTGQNSIAGNSPLTWSPFALSHSIIESPNMFYLKDMTNARYYLYSQNKFSLKLVYIETLSVILYLFFMLGTRILALVGILHRFFVRKIDINDFVFITTIVVLGFMMLGFVQSEDWFNTMQFFAYALIILNYYSSCALARISKIGNKYTGYLLVFLFFVLTIPYTISTSYSTLFDFSKNAVFINSDEVDALHYLRMLDDGVVFATNGFDNGINESDGNNELWQVADTAYVSAISHKQTYASFVREFELIGISSLRSRKDFVAKPEKINIDSLPVRYMYIQKAHPNYQLFKNKLIKSKEYIKILENRSVEIYSKKPVVK